MTITCLQCGKKRTVLYPELWTYKRDGKYLCSYGCMRAWDREHDTETTFYEGDVAKVTKEEKQKAIDIALAGGNPLAYLISLGKSDPQQSWYMIKNEAKKKDPAIVDRLPKKLPTLKQSIAEANGKKPEQLVLEGGKDYQLKVDEAQEPKRILDGVDFSKITSPVNFGGYEVTAITDKALGEFYYDRKFNVIDWRTPEGEEISLNPTGWRNLARQIPEILGVLGVQIGVAEQIEAEVKA